MAFGTIQEEILFTALDFGAKLIFTLSVLLINFTVFDNAVEVRLELVQDYLAREIHKKNVVRGGAWSRASWAGGGTHPLDLSAGGEPPSTRKGSLYSGSIQWERWIGMVRDNKKQMKEVFG